MFIIAQGARESLINSKKIPPLFKSSSKSSFARVIATGSVSEY